MDESKEAILQLANFVVVGFKGLCALGIDNMENAGANDLENKLKDGWKMSMEFVSAPLPAFVFWIGKPGHMPEKIFHAEIQKGIISWYYPSNGTEAHGEESENQISGHPHGNGARIKTLIH